MSRRSPRRESRNVPEQLPLVASVKPRSQLNPEQAAKVAIARRAKSSAMPDHVKLVLTLEVPRAVAERLSAQAIRQGKNLEGVVVDMLKAAAR